MVRIQPDDASEPGTATGGEQSAGLVTSKPFILIGDSGTIFAPRFFPDRLQVTKERELDRSSNFCKGEDVIDKGSKNRDIHVNGRLIGAEKKALDRVGDDGDTFTLSSTTWSGEVMVKTVEYEGPQGYHPPTDSLFWEYTMDLVSTGRDEADGGVGNGIVSGEGQVRVTDEDLEDGQQGL